MRKVNILNSPGNRENLGPENKNPKKRIKKVEEKLVVIGNRGNFWVVQSIPGMEEKDIIEIIERSISIIEEFGIRDF